MRAILWLVLVTAALLAGTLCYLKLLVYRSPVGTVFVAVLAALALVVMTVALSLSTYRGPRWELVSRIWLVVLSACAAYAVVDVAAGFVLLGTLAPPVRSDLTVHHRLVPGTVTQYETAEYEYAQRVNHLGMRGTEVNLKKPVGTYRILMLGDSFTMGKGVADDETFAARLADSLNRSRGEEMSLRFEVLNAGVDSYAPILSRLQLDTFGLRLEPDLVVLNVDMSDLLQEQAYRAIADRDAHGNIVGVPGNVNIGELALGWIQRHLFLTRLLLRYLLGREAGEDAITVQQTVVTADHRLLEHTLASDRIDRRSQWEALFDSVLAIKRRSALAGAEFLMTVYPWGHQVSDSEWAAGRRHFIPVNAIASDESLERIHVLAAANGVALLDAFPSFRRYEGDDPLYYDADMHWTPAGHALMASLLQEAVTELLQPPVADRRGSSRRGG